MTWTRRDFLQRSGSGALMFTLTGVPTLMTPAQAREHGIELQALTGEEALLLDALGEVLVPGAAEAGITHFVDQQLHADPNDCLLLARMFNLETPYLDFYRAGLRALAQACRATHQVSFNALEPDAAIPFVRAMSEGSVDNWQGPPAPLFYVLVRSDAVDVVYGTVRGFEDLGIPYMPHILPPTPW